MRGVQRYRDIAGERHEWCEAGKHYSLAGTEGWSNYGGQRWCPECEARGQSAADAWNAHMRGKR